MSGFTDTFDAYLEEISGILDGDTFNTRKLAKCEELMKNASMEIRMQDDSARKSDMTSKHNAMRARISAEKKKLLLGSGDGAGGGGGGGKTANDRGRMQTTTEKAYDQLETLQRAQAIAAETEQVGTEIMSELQQNRERIVTNQGRAQEINASLEEADVITRRMQRRQVVRENCTIC